MTEDIVAKLQAMQRPGSESDLTVMCAEAATTIATLRAEVVKLRAELKLCGKDNCMGRRVKGVTQWVTEQAKDAAVASVRAEVEGLRADAAKSERRAITFGDILAQHILAMRAAVVAGHLESHAHGLQWIVNTLAGPGHLPDLDEARALGGAQALFDKEMAEHEAFRAAHPVPDAAIDAAKADKEGA